MEREKSLNVVRLDSIEGVEEWLADDFDIEELLDLQDMRRFLLQKITKLKTSKGYQLCMCSN